MSCPSDTVIGPVCRCAWNIQGGWCKTATEDPAPEHQTLQVNLRGALDGKPSDLHPAPASAGPGPCKSPLTGSNHPDSESRTGVEAGLSAVIVGGLNGQTGGTSFEEVRPADHSIDEVDPLLLPAGFQKGGNAVHFFQLLAVLSGRLMDIWNR